MRNIIIHRILKKIGIENLIEILASSLSSTDLQSLMLEVYYQKTRKISPSVLLQQYKNNRFVQPSNTDPRKIGELSLLAFSFLPKSVDLLTLSPLAPLGNCSGLATVHQNKVVSTNRNTEVVADATNVLALESAKRRKELLEDSRKSTQQIKLATIHRHMRAQTLKKSYHTAHFLMLCLTTAGRDEGNFKFEKQSLIEQLTYYIQFLKKGLNIKEIDIKIQLTDFANTASIPKIKVSLKTTFTMLNIETDPTRKTGEGYYEGMCFKLFLFKNNNWFEIGDGGFTNWTQQLLYNSKERFLTSGIALELLEQLFL